MAAAAGPAADAMQKFPDGAHVRLRSRVHGGYLHADEDGAGISLRWLRRRSANAAWRVQRILHDGTNCVLLHSAAYGRYLAASPDPAPPGHRGHRVVQGDYGEEEGVDPVLWKPVGSGHAGYVLLRHVSYRLLRANGRYRRWHAGVSVDDFDNQSTMMHWKVEVIPPRPGPPVLVPPPRINREGFRGLFLLREPAMLQRTIRYVEADNQGNFNLNPNGWATFQFHGRSMFNLRWEVATHLGLALFFFRVIVCVRAGQYGQPTPLVIDLPRNEETLDVVAVIADTPAAQALRYPDVDAH
ncbi:uncharacterized protein LOC120701802 [Panicum virgatum]|nr:uncharacterized protein LOC120701802 [Panicum virgatum]